MLPKQDRNTRGKVDEPLLSLDESLAGYTHVDIPVLMFLAVWMQKRTENLQANSRRRSIYFSSSMC